MKAIPLMIVATALAGCAMDGAQDPGANAQQRFNQLLAGKVAGPPLTCIPEYHANATSVITADAIAFQTSPGQVYVTSTAGSGCSGTPGLNYALVTTSHGGNSLCAGDNVEIRDLQTGTMAGACTLSNFTPYRRP